VAEFLAGLRMEHLTLAALVLGALVLGVIVLLVVRRLRPAPRWIVLDGSNVMFWREDTPRIETVRAVVEYLHKAGFRPIVWFDANLGYKVAGRHMGEEEAARHLGIGAGRVRLSPSGVPADAMLLTEARTLGCPVVSNDRFRDWVEDFPEVRERGTFVRGRVEKGAVRLELVEAPAGRS
jgi:hypothetical protein